ncbi:hypothetical protein [Thalassospira tepidiphila]|uniref:hypothetical protein n=1 Tax=Thalassospira tepidiphila TaxID=393657 RepID=UPI002927260A|nr:hypothetical protein MACH01_20210 [Thalassospira tepidiphila]
MSDKPVYITTALGIGSVVGFPTGLIAAAYVLPISVGDGWANIVGALLGASLTSAAALIVVHRQDKLNRRAKREEQFHNILDALQWLEDIFTSYEEVHSTDYWQALSQTEGVMIDDDKELLAATIKCKRQIQYLAMDLNNVSEELTELKLSDTVPITIRRIFKDCLRPVRLITQDWKHLQPLTVVKEENYYKFFHTTYDIAVSTIPAEIREFKMQTKFLRTEIQNLIEQHAPKDPTRPRS